MRDDIDFDHAADKAERERVLTLATHAMANKESMRAKLRTACLEKHAAAMYAALQETLVPRRDRSPNWEMVARTAAAVARELAEIEKL